MSAGSLTAGNDAALGTGPLSVAASATVNFITANPSINGLSGGGSLILGNATGPQNTSLTVNSNANSSFTGVIAQAAPALGSLIKTGTATLTLSGTNLYTGGTTINQGAIAAASANALGSGPVLLQNGKLSLTAEGGFSGFSAMQLNGGTVVNSSSTMLTLTDGNNTEAQSAFTSIPVQAAGGFTASFVYTDVNKLGADGVTFCVQNDPNGARALGASGGAFGYQNIRNSGAVDFNIYNGHVAPERSSAITSAAAPVIPTAATLPADRPTSAPCPPT